MGCPAHPRELLKLGFETAESTVSKYMARHRGPPSQTWRTFLRNHACPKRRKLFNEAVASQRESIRSQLAVFLHDKHSRTSEPLATRAKRRSRTALAVSGVEAGKSGTM